MQLFNFFKTTSRQYAFRYLLCLSLVFLLSACGFHLRGKFPLAPGFQNIYVSYSQPYEPLIRKLSEVLNHAGVTTVKDATHAEYTLFISQINTNPVLQATSTTGQTSTYSLHYIVVFDVRDASGKVIVPNQQVESSTSYTLTSGQLLTNYNQQPGLIDQLQQDVVSQIMFRLSGHNVTKAIEQARET
jgi:LPS-assembly lipoprotein